MPGSVEQPSGIRNPQPSPFGRQSSTPLYGQSGSDAHSSSSSFEVSPITPFPPLRLWPTPRILPADRASSHFVPHRQHTYRPLSAPLKEGFGDVLGARHNMATAPSLNDRVSAGPANALSLDPARTRSPIPPRSVSDSPGAGSLSVRPSIRSRTRQPSFKELVNKFNNNSDEVLPLPAVSRSTSRAASPTGSEHGSELSNPLYKRRPLPLHHEEPFEDTSWNTNNPRLELAPSSPQIEQLPRSSTSIVPPPLHQRVSDSHPRRPLFGELLTLNTQLDNSGLGIPAHLRRRGSDGSIASPNPAFLDPGNPATSFRTPLTPTAWYLGHANSLEAVQPGVNKNIGHRRSRSDFASPSESLADPWNPDMAVSVPLQQGKPADGSPTSPNSRSRIPISSHRRNSGSGSEPHSPTVNLTFSGRSSTIPLAPKGTSRLPKPLSPTRGTEDAAPSFAMTARGRRDVASGRTRHTVSDRSQLLQAYVSAPPPKKSPPLRSSRPRQTVSVAGPPGGPPPRSPDIGRRLSSLQKVADRTADRGHRRPRQLPELSNVDLETRRQRIQQAFNRTVQENERKEEEAAELRRRTRVDLVAPEGLPEDDEEDQTETPSTTTNHIPLPSEMATAVVTSAEVPVVDGKEPRTVPQLHLNTDVFSENNPHTAMDSPTLGLPNGASPRTLTNGVEGLRVPGSPAPNSASSDHTHFDLEPQTHLITRKPSAAEAHRSLLTQIMQIRESSSSSEDECDEQDCSLSETEDDKDSVQVMIRGQTYFRPSSSVNAEEAQSALRHSQPVAGNPPDHRWSMSSWSSSVQNQESSNDDHCDEEDSGDDLILQRPTTSKEETPSESCSAVSTRPASFADDEHEDGPVQDLGVTGPSTMETAQFNAARFFATPPSLAKKGKWDSRRATQLYLEQLTQGRTADLGLAATMASPRYPQVRPPPGPSSMPRGPAALRQPEHIPRPMESRRQDMRVPSMLVEDPEENLADEPVVVPRIQDPRVNAIRQSNAASLICPDDWEDASPSIMDWMSVAAEDGGLTPAQERTEFIHEGLGLSGAQTSPQPQASPHDPLTAPNNAHIQPQLMQQDQHLPSSERESSEDSTLPHTTDYGQSEKAANSSVTSLTPSAEQPPRSSPSPEQRRLKQRRHVIKELVDTEYTFTRDMRVVEDIYKGTSGSCLDLSPEDVRTLFGNSADIVQFSQSFQDSLKQAARSVYVMPKSQRWSSKRGNRPAAPTDEEEQTTSGTGISDHDKDCATLIGEAFVVHIPQMEKVYAEYLKNYEAANQKLQTLQRNPKVEIWLKECRDWAADLTTAWNLDALLIKPMQRFLKYPLLLSQLLDATLDDHPDYTQLVNARTELTAISVRINDMKKRADVVGKVVGRKRNQSDVRAGLSKAFGRRTEKFRQQVGMSDLFEDKEYDLLYQNFGSAFFHLQLVMRDVQNYTLEASNYMRQLNEFILSIEAVMNVSPSNYPELESKWRQFKAAMKDCNVVLLPEHLSTVSETIIQPMVILLKLHEGPQRLMKKREKRLLDYTRYKALQTRGDKPDKKTTEQGEQFIALNDTLKEELPKLYDLTSKLMEACLLRLAQSQTTWWGLMQKKIQPHVDIFPDGFEDVIPEWTSDWTFAEAQLYSLGICNGSIRAESSNMSSFNTPQQGGGVSSPRQASISSARRTSTANSSTHRKSVAEDSPKVSQDFGGVSGLFQSPRVDSSSVASRHRSGSTFSGRGPLDSPNTSRNLQHVTEVQPQPQPQPQQQPPPSSSSSAAGVPHPNSVESFPNLLPALSIEGPFLADILKATGNDSSLNSSRYSGFFSSAMPMSDNPNESESSREFDGHGAKEPQALFTAASLYEFNIDRARREAGYPYLTYVAGEIFDIIGEKGELWLARNQDDSTHQVGWIWNKHFAKLSS
ncbi:hypothetical protein N7488_003051 [Penicillium malachiteum]|nr:hypothetical protein N7488_003051 [Penicillium malachiteum]